MTILHFKKSGFIIPSINVSNCCVEKPSLFFTYPHLTSCVMWQPFKATTADANMLENGINLTVMGLNEDYQMLAMRSPAN